MFVASRFPVHADAHAEAPCSQFEFGEGRQSESSRGLTEALLLPRGRPGPWLLLVLALWLFVLLQSNLAG